MTEPVRYYDVSWDEMRPITQEIADLLQEVSTHFMLLRVAISEDAKAGHKIGPAVSERLRILEERRKAMQPKKAMVDG